MITKPKNNLPIQVNKKHLYNLSNLQIYLYKNILFQVNKITCTLVPLTVCSYLNLKTHMDKLYFFISFQRIQVWNNYLLNYSS